MYAIRSYYVGGIYDMVSIGRNYDSDHIIARFAVVQRRRMAVG